MTLCMSQHARLGADSKLALLDPALMRLIVEYACESGGCVVFAECIVQLLEKTDAESDSPGDKQAAGPVLLMISG